MHPGKKTGVDHEIRFYESLLVRLPDDVDTLKLLAEAYTSSGRVKDGLEVDFKLRELCPNDVYVRYNLACSLSLCGQVDDALVTLKDAIKLGYSDLKWMNSDPDLNNLRRDPRYSLEILPLFNGHIVQ